MLKESICLADFKYNSFFVKNIMDNMQESKDYISKLSHHLFWDIDISNADMDKTIEPNTLELLKKLPQ